MHLKYKGYKIKVQIWDGDIWLHNTEDIIEEHDMNVIKIKELKGGYNPTSILDRLELVNDTNILIYDYIKTFKQLPQIGMQFKTKRYDPFKVNEIEMGDGFIMIALKDAEDD